MSDKPQDSYIDHHRGGTMLVGPDAMKLFKAATLKSSLTLYDKTKLIPTRGVTITVMLRMATEFTNKTYKRTQVLQAAADLQVWIDTMRAAIPHLEDGKQV